MTKEEAIRRAEEEFERVLDKTLLVDHLVGYIGYGDAIDFYPDPPARVRVVDGTLDHWLDEWLDPYWDVELVEPHPDIPEEADSFWMYGTSYNTITDQVDHCGWREEPEGCEAKGYW